MDSGDSGFSSENADDEHHLQFPPTRHDAGHLTSIFRGEYSPPSQRTQRMILRPRKLGKHQRERQRAQVQHIKSCPSSPPPCLTLRDTKWYLETHLCSPRALLPRPLGRHSQEPTEASSCSLATRDRRPPGIATSSSASQNGNPARRNPKMV